MRNAPLQARPGYLRRIRESPLGRRLDLGTLELLSERAEACPLQDPFRIRARYLGWKTASLLIDGQGELHRPVLEQLIQELTLAPYPLGREGDVWLYNHLARSLTALAADEKLARRLLQCSLPLCNKTAEEIVRQTLWPEEIGALTVAHVRRAVLSAWLTYLRQATGSCFATAPAMLIQREEPRFLLEDLDLLLSAGEVRRGGSSVPMNPGAGAGDLHKPFGPLPPPFSPGLRSAFYAAGLPASQIPSTGATAQAVIDEALLAHFQLTREDLEQEKESLAPSLGVLWERMGGHLTAPTQRSKQIRDWELARQRAVRAFLATADCALLRCWEYTIASFCDVKVEFARWNLYVSLGVHPDHSPPGIGRALHDAMQPLLDRANHDIQQLQVEHQTAVNAMRSAESLLHRAASSAHRNQIKAELAAAMHTAHSLDGLLQEKGSHAEWLSRFYPELLQQVIDKLQHFFQEVFEPTLAAEADPDQFEDSPAGFRLICKHGRASAASWERIESAQQFVDAVYRFFESLEQELVVPQHARNAVSGIATSLLQYVRTEEFLQGAILRSKANQAAKRATPWAYVSGGTMQTLLMHYFHLPTLPREFSRHIHSEQELLSFLSETAAQWPKGRPCLMLSPNHGFLFCPDWLGAARSSERNKRFLTTLSIGEGQADFLQERFSLRIPEDRRPLFFYGCRQAPVYETIASLRQSLVQGVLAAKDIQESAVDGFLYESLPLFTQEEAHTALQRISETLSARFGVRIELTPEFSAPFFTPLELVEHLKAALFASGAEVFSPIDWEQEIVSIAREELFLYPQPLLFGDTNWSEWCFGFIQNLASGRLELWRLSRTAQRGEPMAAWNSFFREGKTWSILPP